MKSITGLIIASSTTFAVTNIDDAVLVTLFFAKRVSTRTVVFGQCLGFAGIASLSLAGLWATILIPGGWLRFLGILPLAIGIKHLVATHRIEWESGARNPGIVSIAAITLTNGADNCRSSSSIANVYGLSCSFMQCSCCSGAGLEKGWETTHWSYVQ
jgi:cadmium resistance protein CadD (predicted permease)